MGGNLPPGVSVNDLPGNEPVPDEAPGCLLCREDEDQANCWNVVVEGTADGQVHEVTCEVHGDLDQEEWEMMQI